MQVTTVEGNGGERSGKKRLTYVPYVEAIFDPAEPRGLLLRRPTA
jgi:hypothetical protein